MCITASRCKVAVGRGRRDCLMSGCGCPAACEPYGPSGFDFRKAEPRTQFDNPVRSATGSGTAGVLSVDRLDADRVAAAGVEILIVEIGVVDVVQRHDP